MKTIAIFGCSFTAGHGHNQRRWINWPAEMALYTNDEYKIVNCARGGTSMLYSVHMLDTYLKNFPRPDLVLFQFTTDARVSWVSDAYGEKDYTKVFEYMTLREWLSREAHDDTDKYNYLRNVYRIYPRKEAPFGYMTAGGWIDGADELAKLYYGTIGRNLFTPTESDAMMSHVKYLTRDIPCMTITQSKDFYSVKSQHFKDNLDFSFDEALGKDYFENNIIDDGKHLSEQALQKLGKLVYLECKERKLL